MDQNFSFHGLGKTSNGKFNELVGRLKYKIQRSQTTVPGFIIGLSGSDSVLAFLLLYRAAEEMGFPERVVGVNYVGANRRKVGWFEEQIFPWLKKVCPKAELVVATPLGGNQDQQRWADLHLRALNEVHHNEAGEPNIVARLAGENLWVCGAMNLTEKRLGKYSMLSTAVSVSPIQTLSKTKVLAILADLGAPTVLLQKARLPDCLCGREELAANNIELIDRILDYDPTVSEEPAELVAKLCEYIRQAKGDNDFKTRIPYVI